MNPEKSKNIGGMAKMKMIETIHQSSTALDITEDTEFRGKPEQETMHFDLSGAPARNHFGMDGMSTTVSKWQDGKLVTTWTPRAGVPGMNAVRTETRWLSRDGKTMTLESVRGENEPVTIVFDRQ